MRAKLELFFVIVICAALLFFTYICVSSAAEQPRQPLPTEQDVLSGIVAQQAKANAELTVRVMHLEQELQAQRARADAAEAKFKSEIKE
jgi:hypothetical protein